MESPVLSDETIVPIKVFFQDTKHSAEEIESAVQNTKEELLKKAGWLGRLFTRKSIERTAKEALASKLVETHILVLCQDTHNNSYPSFMASLVTMADQQRLIDVDKGCVHKDKDVALEHFQKTVDHLTKDEDWKGKRFKSVMLEAVISAGAYPTVEGFMEGLQQAGRDEMFKLAFPKTKVTHDANIVSRVAHVDHEDIKIRAKEPIAIDPVVLEVTPVAPKVAPKKKTLTKVQRAKLVERYGEENIRALEEKIKSNHNK